MAVDLALLLADLQAETDDLVRIVESAGPLPDALQRPTPAVPWSVGDTLGHLWFFDREARRAAVDPGGFSDDLTAMAADVDGYMSRALATAAGLGNRVLLEWLAERSALVEALSDVPPSTRIPWYGPPMSAASSATARLMETWAHGQDIADALGIDRRPTDRLRHICHLGVRTRNFSYVVRGMSPPEGDVRVELAPPDGGEPWEFGPASTSDRIVGPALDFCLLVTQRRLPGDLALQVTGPAAAEWVSIAQAFAGSPSLTDAARRGLPARHT
jgi:uncharacterized protein (TIGR03084 family)